MPELIEQMYCSQQIVIPPKFPYILKKFAKAAIKTQPYDLLRWSCEYFHALASNRTPPVKLRLEYPIFCTAGGLTAGYLRTINVQLQGSEEVSKSILERTWLGACLDPAELARILCLCGAGEPGEKNIPILVFFAVAAGLLTQSLTQTMILLCETLTKEPDGGSAAVPVENFLIAYEHIAQLDCSSDVTYIDGFREGEKPIEEEVVKEAPSVHGSEDTENSVDEWGEGSRTRHLELTGERYSMATRVSTRLSRAPIPLRRSLSRERDVEMEQLEFNKRKERPTADASIDSHLREMRPPPEQEPDGGAGAAPPAGDAAAAAAAKPEGKKAPSAGIMISIQDEDGKDIPLVIYGEGMTADDEGEDDSSVEGEEHYGEETAPKKKVVAKIVAPDPFHEVKLLLEKHTDNRELRVQDMINTQDELAAIVHRWQHANYDLGTIAGRQMSSTSGEFIAESAKKELMAAVDEIIVTLPDPDLKKKKAKPEEVAMVREVLEDFLTENMETIVPEQEIEEEEEQVEPETVTVYAVPGIGAAVPQETYEEFVKYAWTVSGTQAGLFMPRNIRHFLCPPLELYIDPPQEPEEEEAAPGVPLRSNHSNQVLT